MEYVWLCQVCGTMRPLDSINRCADCRSFSGLTTVTRTEAVRLIRHRKLRSLRVRMLRLSLAGALLAGLTVLVALHYFDLGPVPLGPTTSISANVGPETWAQGRRTHQNSGFTPDQPPLPAIVKWEYATSAPVMASPAVVDGRIYVSTEDGLVLCLGAEHGQPLWEYHSGLLPGSTPAVAGNLLIVPFRLGNLLAFHKETGVLVWERNIESPVLGSPLVVEGRLYIGAGDNNLYALDAATGENLWTFEAKDWIISSVAYQEGTVVVASQGRLIHVLNARTGRQRLVYDTGLSRRAAGPAIQGDLVYFPSDGGLVWAIDLQALSYPFDRFLWWINTNLYIWQVTSNPPVQKGSAWVNRVDGDIATTPAVAHDTVYFSSTHGKVFAREAGAGQERWTTNVGVDITAAPTVAGDTVVVGTADGTIFGLDAYTGQVIWDFNVGAEVTAGPIVVGDALYVVSADGKLHSITGVE